MTADELHGSADQGEAISRIRAVFDEWARNGDAEGMEESHGPFARHVFERFPLTESSWYLDVGCGNGYSVRWAAARARRGRAVGVDLSPEMIERARSLSTHLPNVEFHLGAFPGMALPAGRFDAIFSMEVLYYLPDMQPALEAIRELLTPRGLFACAVDYYAENAASHAWPADVGLEMRLLDEAGWRVAFERAGLVVADQFRVRLPPDQASEPWKAEEGSLVTMGKRP